MKRLNLPKERTFTGPALVWKRIAAFFIDIVIINVIILLPFRRLFQRILPKEYSFSEAYKLLSSEDFTGYITAISIAMAVLIFLYFYLMEKKMGQTIGKKLMKIYVASDNPASKSWQFLVRNLVFMPIFPIILLWIIDPLFMFFNRSSQRLTEILSKTRVVEIYSLGQ